MGSFQSISKRFLKISILPVAITTTKEKEASTMYIDLHSYNCNRPGCRTWTKRVFGQSRSAGGSFCSSLAVDRGADSALTE